MLFTFSPGVFSVIQFNNSQTGPGLTTLVTGLCAFYSFEGNTNDSTNNGLNLGTGASSSYNFITGKTGASAIQFTNYGICGAAAGLTYPNNIWNIYDGVTNASFSFWIKIPQYFPSVNPAFSTCGMTIFGADYGNFGFSINPAGPTGAAAPNMLVFSLAGNTTPSITATFITNTWCHFAGVLNNTNKTYTVYRNGAVLSAVSFTSITAPSQNYQGFAIDGSGQSTNGEYGVPCTFDAVGLWNRALSASEITTLYNGGSGIQYPFTYNANYLLVGGGGGGGVNAGGAGGNSQVVIPSSGVLIVASGGAPGFTTGPGSGGGVGGSLVTLGTNGFAGGAGGVRDGGGAGGYTGTGGAGGANGFAGSAGAGGAGGGGGNSGSNGGGGGGTGIYGSGSNGTGGGNVNGANGGGPGSNVTYTAGSGGNGSSTNSSAMAGSIGTYSYTGLTAGVSGTNTLQATRGGGGYAATGAAGGGGGWPGGGGGSANQNGGGGGGLAYISYNTTPGTALTVTVGSGGAGFGAAGGGASGLVRIVWNTVSSPSFPSTGVSGTFNETYN